MKRVDEERLESDLAYRFGYLAEFMGFGEEDVRAIHAAAPAVAPLVPGLVDAVYQKLFSYDATRRPFMARQHGYDGPVPARVEDVTQDHPLIVFRKEHLAGYLKALVTRPYDTRMVDYLDWVGKIHTPNAGNEEVNVPLVQMNALMGFVSDALTAAILELNVDQQTKATTLRAFQKLLWLQNDAIVRQYAASNVEAAAA